MDHRNEVPLSKALQRREYRRKAHGLSCHCADLLDDALTPRFGAKQEDGSQHELIERFKIFDRFRRHPALSACNLESVLDASLDDPVLRSLVKNVRWLLS